MGWRGAAAAGAAALAVFARVHWEDVTLADNALHIVLRLTSAIEPLTVGTMWELRYPEDAAKIAAKRVEHNMAYDAFDWLQVTAAAEALRERTQIVAVPRRGGGGSIAVHVVRPLGDAVRPVVVYVHGGGGVIGSAAGGGGIRQVAAELDVVVAAVEYRLAPEHPFPAGLDDCVDVVRHVAARAGDYGGDPRRIGVIGLSMGGGIAAAVAAETRDTVRAQGLIVPVVTYGAATRSYLDYGTIPSLPIHAMLWMWQQYAPDAAACVDDPRCSPLRRGDLSGLPAAVVMPATADVIRDEGEEYARRLAAAGVPTQTVMMRSTHIGALARFDADAFQRFNAAFRALL